MIKISAAAVHVLGVAQARMSNPTPGRVFLAPGAQVAWDSCCDRQLAVRVISIQPRQPRNDPNRLAPNPMCSVPSWVVRMAVQLIQCVTTVDERGRPPASAVLTGEGTQILDHAATIHAGLLCDVDDDYRLRIIQWTSLGPEGGCAGGEWEIEIEIDA